MSILIITAVICVSAQTSSAENNTSGDTPTSNLLLRPSATAPRPTSSIAPGQAGTSASATGTIREKIREDIQSHVQNTKDNQNIRNKIMPVTSNRNQAGTNSPTTTAMMLEIQKEKQLGDKRKETRMELFREERNAVVKNLQQVLNNLKQLRTRAESRIVKAEASGRDMTQAKSLLPSVDIKITNAQTAIDKVSQYMANGTSTASTTIDLKKPRELVNAANKAIKEVKESLNEVIKSIAHAMGLELGNSTTTPPLGTSTPPFGTSTPPMRKATPTPKPRPNQSANPVATTTNSIE